MSLPFPIVERNAWGLKSDFFFAVEICFSTGAILTGGAVNRTQYAGSNPSSLISNAHYEESKNSCRAHQLAGKRQITISMTENNSAASPLEQERGVFGQDQKRLDMNWAKT